ncbi:hypothetical protein HDU67_005874 [Dinochytrium kinnereticum]|nr:hypothetical protein HDU67_005874 [Dinochytrium kinnereticum]
MAKEPHLRTELTDLLDIKYPIVCPPMAGASCPSLAANVSLAGGLGFIAAAYGKDPSTLRKEIATAKALAKGKPIGVGFITWFLDKHPEMLEAVEWIQLAIDRIAMEENPAVFWFSFGDFARHAARVKEECPDAIIMAQIRTVSEAGEAVDRCGADVIVAQGIGAGGHGEKIGASTLSLVPEVVDAIGDRAPVLAAGGISDGRQLAACLLLGASGVVMGTRFCASIESAFTKKAKFKLVETQDGGIATARTRAYEVLRDLDWPQAYDFRVLRNDFVDSALQNQENFKHIEEWRVRFQEAMAANNYDVAYLAMGEGVGLVKGVWPAQRIIELTMQGAVDILKVGVGAADRTRAKLKPRLEALRVKKKPEIAHLCMKSRLILNLRNSARSNQISRINMSTAPKKSSPLSASDRPHQVWDSPVFGLRSFVGGGWRFKGGKWQYEGDLFPFEIVSPISTSTTGGTATPVATYVTAPEKTSPGAHARETGEGTAQHIKSAASGASQKGQEGVQKAKEAAAGAYEKAKEMASGQKMQEGMQSAKEGASEGYQKGKEMASGAGQRMQEGVGKAQETASSAYDAAKEMASGAGQRMQEGAGKAEKTASAAYDRSKELASETGQRMQEGAGKAQEAAASTYDKTKENISAAGQTLQSEYEKAGEMAGEALKRAQETAAAAYQKAKEMTFGAGHKMQEGYEKGRETGEAMAQRAQEIGSATYDRAKEMASSAGESMQSGYQKTSETASDAAKHAQEAAGSTYEKAKDVASDTGGKMQSGASKAQQEAGRLSQQVSEGASQAASQAQHVGGSVYEKALGAAESTREAIGHGVERAYEGVTGLAQQAVEGTKGAVRGVYETVGGIAGTVGHQASEAGKGAADVASGSAHRIREGAGKAAEVGQDVTGKAASSLRETTRDVYEAAAGVSKAATHNLQEGTKSAVEEAQDLGHTGVGMAKGVYERVAHTLEDASHALSETASTLAERAKEVVGLGGKHPPESAGVGKHETVPPLPEKVTSTGTIGGAAAPPMTPRDKAGFGEGVGEGPEGKKGHFGQHDPLPRLSTAGTPEKGKM